MKVQRLIFVLTILILTACQSQSNIPGAMPLTMENIEIYMQSVLTGAKGQGENVSMDPMEAYRKNFAVPMEKMGYKYDSTIQAAALKMHGGLTQQEDPRLAMALTGLVYMPYQMNAQLLEAGIISAETSNILKNVNLEMPH